jgi:predicted  nucleic acid-binding Zn-ribbon protein
LKELRRIRDRSKVLETEHSALQQRFEEQETRAAEWEQRATESEATLAETQAALEDAECRAAQLAEEHAKVKAAEERLTMVCLSFITPTALPELKNRWCRCQDRENKLRDQVAALEARVAQLQYSATRSTKMGVVHNISSPPRPDSRASTVYPSRAATPTMGMDMSRTNTPPASVWDSIHAPSAVSVSRKQVPVPRSRYVKQDWPSRVASPTPSVVSVAPTLGKDGWYE